MRRRLRNALPPAWFVAIALFGWVALEAIYVLAQWQGFAEELPPDFHRGRGAFLIVAVVLYAAWRVLWFHPLTRPGYGEWLHTTPWRHPQPLPLGTVLPTWADAAVVAVAALLLLFWGDDGIDPAAVPIAFLLTWSALASGLLSGTGQRICAYAVWFGFAVVTRVLALALRLPAVPLAAAVATVLITAVAVIGMRRSLARFHYWKVSTLGEAPRNVPPQHLGWPVARLHPQPEPAGISRGHSLMLSLLAAWWCAWVPAPLDGRWFVVATVGAVLAVVRIIRYLDGYAWPISLRGRIATGRLILPRYDRVFIAPIAALLASVGLPLLIEAAGWSLEFGLPIAAAATLLAVLAIGPTIEEWRLTGDHRVMAGFGHL